MSEVIDDKSELIKDMLDDVIARVRLSKGSVNDRYDIIDMLKEIERLL